MTTKSAQAWHSRIVTELMYSANGDLILDQRGNLCTRVQHDPQTWADLPFAQHGIGDVLAVLSRDGWTLTQAGAQFILENCPAENAHDRRVLEAVAADRDAVHVGVTFRRNSAEGVYRSRVLRAHRDFGYWETQIIEGGHPALIGSIQVVSDRDIRQARTGRY